MSSNDAVEITGQLEAVVKGLKKTTLFAGALGAKDAAAAQAPALTGGEGNVDDDLEGEVRRVAPRVGEDEEDCMGNRAGGGGAWGVGVLEPDL